MSGFEEWKAGYIADGVQSKGVGVCWDYLEMEGGCDPMLGMCTFKHPYMTVAAMNSDDVSKANTKITMSHDVPEWRTKILANKQFKMNPRDLEEEQAEDETEEPEDEECSFGKHKGKLFSEIVKSEHDYVDFCRGNVSGSNNAMGRLVAFADANRGLEMCTFGKHKGSSFEQILKTAPSYIDWCKNKCENPTKGMQRLIAYADAEAAALPVGSSGSGGAARGLVFYSNLKPAETKEKLIDMFDGRRDFFDPQIARMLDAIGQNTAGPFHFGGTSGGAPSRARPY